MKCDENGILLDMFITKPDAEEFTDKEVNDFLDGYIEYVESKGLHTGGGCRLATKELLDKWSKLF